MAEDDTCSAQRLLLEEEELVAECSLRCKGVENGAVVEGAQLASGRGRHLQLNARGAVISS